MDPLVQIIAIILCAKVLGELVERFGFPSLIGEVAAGIVLGPAILNLVSPNEFIEFFADIGIIVLLFMSGAQLNMKTFAKSEKAGIVTGLAGVAFPSAFGVAAGYLVGLGLYECIYLGIALAVTSIGISVRTLVDLRQLKSDIGMIIVAAAVVDDVIGIILLGVLTTLASGIGGFGTVALTMVLITVFFILILTLGKKIILWSFESSRSARTHEMPYSVAILIALGTAVIAQEAGLHYAIGAFLAGLILGDSIRSDRLLYDSLADFAFGFFTTVFFASIGLFISFSSDSASIPFILLIVIVAFAGKVAGGYVGSFWFLRDRARSLIVGLGLSPRGEISLVVSKVALSSGLISATLFSSVTVMVIISIFLTPILMTRGFLGLQARGGPPTGDER